MELTYVVIGLSAAGLAVAIVLPTLVNKWAKRRTEQVSKSAKLSTKDTLQFLVNLMVNSSSDPDTVRRLLDDVAKTGQWRGKIFRRPDGGYSIGWEP